MFSLGALVAYDRFVGTQLPLQPDGLALNDVDGWFLSGGVDLTVLFHDNFGASLQVMQTSIEYRVQPTTSTIRQLRQHRGAGQRSSASWCISTYFLPRPRRA